MLSVYEDLFPGDVSSGLLLLIAACLLLWNIPNIITMLREWARHYEMWPAIVGGFSFWYFMFTAQYLTGFLVLLGGMVLMAILSRFRERQRRVEMPPRGP